MQNMQYMQNMENISPLFFLVERPKILYLWIIIKYQLADLSRPFGLVYEDHHTEVIFYCLLHCLYCKAAKEIPLSLWKVFQFATFVLIWQKTIAREIICMYTSWKGSRATLSLTLANHHPKILRWDLMQSCKNLRDEYNTQIQKYVRLIFNENMVPEIWFLTFGWQIREAAKYYWVDSFR